MVGCGSVRLYRGATQVKGQSLTEFWKDCKCQHHITKNPWGHETSLKIRLQQKYGHIHPLFPQYTLNQKERRRKRRREDKEMQRGVLGEKESRSGRIQRSVKCAYTAYTTYTTHTTHTTHYIPHTT
jgi:hypothetical protein